MMRTRRKRKFPEAVDDSSGIELCCCLCKTSSEESSIRPDPATIDKMKICIGQEISPETDPAAKICDKCLQELDMHHSFWKQALQCNVYAQNQMAADEAELVDVSTEIRVCRFCLKMGRKLIELFPKGKAPNEHQLEKIRECLAVQMNSWDPVTKICRTCVKRIQQFLDFQAKHVPVSMFLKTEPPSHQSNEMVKEEVHHGDGLDLDLSVSDSDCSVVEYNREDPLSAAKSKPGAIQPELLDLLANSSEERNFSIVLQNGEQLKVAFENYQFRYHSMNDCGGSVWYCLEARLRRCSVKLQIDNAGKTAQKIGKYSKHSHSAQRPKFMECPSGKGFVQFGEDDDPFWLFNPRRNISNQTRCLIYAGFRYSLVYYNNDSPLSRWRCVKQCRGSCMAVLQVEGVFQRVQIFENHNHTAMTQDQIDEALKGCPIDLAATEAISEFQKNNPVQAVLPTYPKNTPQNEQQQAIKSVPKEKEPDTSLKLLECPLGKGFVQFGGDNEPFWLFNPRPTISNHTRCLIYVGYRYTLDKCSSSLSTWRCVKRCKGRCAALLQVEGVFRRIHTSRNHNHAALDQDQINEALKGCPSDLAATEAIHEFQINNPVQAVLQTFPKSKPKNEQQQQEAIESVIKEKDPDIFKLLQEEDSERNFAWVKAGSKLKLKHEGFEYRYFGTQEDESTLWKCIMDALHHCKTIAMLSANGKHLEMFTGPRHSHPKEPAAFFGYPLGKRMVGEEPLWMIKRFNVYFETRSLIYRDHVFILKSLHKKGMSRWGCLRKHSCRASLFVMGDFTNVNLRTDHSHEKTPEDILKKMLEDHSQPLGADENLSFKQRLLTYPSIAGKVWDEVRKEHETFYVLNKLRSAERIGYGLIFRRYKYSFIKVDRRGTSRWKCCKQGGCSVSAIVEGLYESIFIKGEHNHEMMSDSEINLLMQRNMTNTVSDDSCLVQHAANSDESKNVLSILAHQDPDRNFSVGRFKTKLLIKFDEEDFRVTYLQPDGTSSWVCIWKKIRMCPVVLRLSADGKQVTKDDPEMKHNHSEEQIALFYLAYGKASVYDEDIDAYRFYWLYSFPNVFRTNLAIIYQGYKYCLKIIRNKGSSDWRCNVRNCGVLARVEDCLKIISCKDKHNHDPLSNEDILALTGLPKVDEDLLPDGGVLGSVSAPSTEGPLRPSTLLKLLSADDSERNFQVSIDKDFKKTKILQDGHEYTYRSSNETHSLWICIYCRARGCRTVLHIDNHCKQGSLPEFPKHNHPIGLFGIFKYPQGKSTIMDSSTETTKPFWFLIQPDFVRPCPILIYEQNKFLLLIIKVNGESQWQCAGKKCPVKLTVTGMFESIESTGSPHNHEFPSEEKLATWIQNLGKTRKKLQQMEK